MPPDPRRPRSPAKGRVVPFPETGGRRTDRGMAARGLGREGGRPVRLPATPRGRETRPRLPGRMRPGQPAPGRGERPDPAARWRRPRRILWLLAGSLGLGVILVLGLVVRDLLAILPSQTAHPVRHGEVQLAVTAEALLLRDEWVHVSPAGGSLERVVQEGQAVRAGTPVARVGGSVLRAERPGIISYQVDGLEAELSPHSLGWLRGSVADGATSPGPEWLEGLPLRRVEAPGHEVVAGQPVFKVVDNSGLWLAVTGPAEGLRPVLPGDLARVEFPALGERSYHFSVAYKSAPGPERTLLALAALDPFPEPLVLLRRTPARLVLGRWEGWVVPRAALTVSGGKPGVKVETAAGSRFVPVTVLGQNQTEAAVKGDLHLGDQVLVPVRGQ